MGSTSFKTAAYVIPGSARHPRVSMQIGARENSNVIECPQRLHHHLDHSLGGDLALALAFELAYDFRDRLIDALGLDRTLAQRDLQRAQQLIPIEWHATAVALDDDQLAQLHPFERGEAEIARKSHPTAADDGGILGRPRILDLRIEAAAVWTPHGGFPYRIPLLARSS